MVKKSRGKTLYFFRSVLMLNKFFLGLIIFTLILFINPGFADAEWDSLGPGGGGSMYSPASSPHDPDLMFVSCDMGGLYRSEDGGNPWRMVDQKQITGAIRCKPVFHPTDPVIVYTYSSGKLQISSDRGQTWSTLWNTP